MAGVDLEVKKGEFVSIMGSSGSGKSTLMNILGCLDKPTSGDYILDGINISKVKDSQLSQIRNKKIGFVFQSFNLLPKLNALENVELPMVYAGIDSATRRKKAENALEWVGLAGRMKHKPNEMSGGQRQRVAFARALAPNPQLLLLDEPFAAIDAKVRQELRSWLKEMIEKLGVTSIFVTHDQDEAIEVADEIIITNKGRVEQKGSPVEIYQNPQTAFAASFFGQTSLIENYTSFSTFDEIEKAHPDVFNILLQVLDDGRITDSQGRTVDFKNTIIILTSNLGSSFILDGIQPDNTISEEAREQVSNLLKSQFRPEFLNRIDEIVFYKPLAKTEITSIVDLMLHSLENRLADKQLKLEVTPSAKDFIIDSGYDPVYGARPLKRFIQSHIETLVGRMIIAEDLAPDTTIVVDYDGNKLVASSK